MAEKTTAPEPRASSVIAGDLWASIEAIEGLIAELPEVAPAHGTPMATQKLLAETALQNIKSLAALATSG